jgi:Putative phage metallopeptidase
MPKKDSSGKKINFLIIPEQDAQGIAPEAYKILKEVRDRDHGDTKASRIALAWRLRLKPDPDGRLELGKCIKVSDLYREYADYDFIITLNKEVWEDERFIREKKLALLDHEMCHTAPVYDAETGEHKADERGRFLFRIRRHSIEEFHEIVHRHGCYKADLEAFAQIILEKKKTASLFPVTSPAAQQDAIATIQ